jgi:hypothetical protein
MAASYAIATQTLIDGPRNSVFKTTGDILGTSLPVAASDIIVASALTPVNPGMSGSAAPTLLRIDHIDYSITDGMVAVLSWDATTPVAICELYGRGKLEAAMWGGYQNNAGAGVTGSISLALFASTATAPSDGSILLVIKTVKYHANI